MDTEPKNADRLLEVTAKISQNIVMIKDRHQLLTEICEELVKYAYRMVWIGFCDEQTKTVVPEAVAGFDGGYLQSVTMTYDQTEYGQGPTGMAVKTKKPSIMNSIGTADPRFNVWRQSALKRGYHSSAGMPIFEGDHVIGVLNVYSENENAFSEKEVKLLEDISRNISAALNKINK